MLAAKFGAILPHLDERQRRLLLGAEARALGHGGIRLVARAARGPRGHGVAGGRGAGVRGGAAGPGPPAGRGAQAGREPIRGWSRRCWRWWSREERGDPVSPLRWTGKSARALAGELTAPGPPGRADTVHKLLHERGVQPAGQRQDHGGDAAPGPGRASSATSTSRPGPTWHAGRPGDQRGCQEEGAGRPVRQPGRGPGGPKGDPVRVRDHDFPGPEPGKAIPYGIYDLAANAGWVNVGTDHDTAAFAVESIRRWWNAPGAAGLPRRAAAADHRRRRRLQRLPHPGLEGRAGRAGRRRPGWRSPVCHFPPGTSKWNKIEHRLFSHITMNWRGRPLTSHEVIVSTIAATTTRTGLTVHAELDTGTYPHRRQGHRRPDGRPTARPATTGTATGTTPCSPPRPPPGRHRPAAPAAPGPDLAWLAHPAITGMTGPALDALTAALAGPPPPSAKPPWTAAAADRPRQPPPAPAAAPASPSPTSSSPLILRDRHGLPCKAIAALLGIRHEHTSRYTGDIRTAPAPDRPRHPARPPQARHPRRPLPLRRRTRHHHPSKDQDSVLITGAPKGCARCHNHT